MGGFSAAAGKKRQTHLSSLCWCFGFVGEIGLSPFNSPPMYGNVCAFLKQGAKFISPYTFEKELIDPQMA